MVNKSLRKDNLINEVIEKHSKMVYRLAFSQVKSKEEAEDVFQEVFLRYIRKDIEFENDEHEKAWFLRVTINCCKKFWASAWIRKTVPLEDTITFNLPEEKDLYYALIELPAKYRRVVHLFYYEDMPVDEISKIINVKPSTIRMQLTRGRAMLKEKLKGEYSYE